MPNAPILVTGAGRVESVGRTIVELLLERDLRVRALVHAEDERSEGLRQEGAEVAVADLTRPDEVARALQGCRRVYFGMSVSPAYLEASVAMAAAARHHGDLEVLVNISQLTVSQMDLLTMTDSEQQRQHWLAEQALNWSGLPVVHVRPTVFLQNPFFSPWAAESIAADGTIRLPFGAGRTSPVDADDVAAVAAAILAEPGGHIGRVYELTGPRSEDMPTMAAEYSDALGKSVVYVDVPMSTWRTELLRMRDLPPYLLQHLVTMAQLHAENRYDRFSRDVELVTGRPPTSVRAYVARHPRLFGTHP
jgi:NAD(P)H dehydrogenase (quinone)